MPPEPSQTTPAGDDEIDLGELGRAIAAQWRRIATLAAITTVLALLLVLFSRPEFTIDGSLYLGDAQNSPGAAAAEGAAGGLGFLGSFSSVSDVQTQIELIRAKALIEQAILETGLNAPVTRHGAANLRFWRWKLLGADIDAFAPQPGDVRALFATLAEPTDKTKRFLIVFGPDGSYHIYRPGFWFSSPPPILTGVLGQPASGGGLSLVLQPAIAGAIPEAGSRFDVRVTAAETLEAKFIAKGIFTALAGGTVTQPTKLANLEMVYPNPYEGQLFLNQLMQDFIATQISWKTQAASVTEQFISGQLSTIQDLLAKSDSNLAAYQSQTGILDVPANAKAVIDELSQYEVQRTTIRLQSEVLQQLSDEIAHPQGELDPYLVSQANDLVLGELAEALSTAEVKLQTARVQFTGNAPEIQADQAAVNRIQTSIKTLVRNDLALSVNSQSDIDSLIAQYESQLKLMPAESLQVVALSRSSDVYGSLYVLLMEKKEDAEVSKAATIINTRIVSPPEIPTEASKPKALADLLAGLLLGIFAGIAFTLAQRALSGRFQTDDEIRRTIALPVYGLIPRRGRAENQASIISNRPQGPFAEAFRLLRSNLSRSAVGAKNKVVLVSSAAAGDGKTTISTNLAKSLADNGRRVLLIDADLHRGRLHQALTLNQAPGLTEWLVTGQRPLFQTLAGERFAVLTNGILPPNPSELLNEAPLGAIFAELREEFDHLIVDGPPLPAVADTMSLGPLADVILSVIRVGQTQRRAFTIHNETIGSLGCRHGMVINGVTGGAYGYGYGDAQNRDKTGRVMAWLNGIWERFG